MAMAPGRAEVAEAVAFNILGEGLQAFMDEHPETRDLDGDNVVIALDATESAENLIDLSSTYSHPVLVSTIYLDTFMIFVLGTSIPSDAQLTSPTMARLAADASTTVGRLFQQILELREGEEFILEFRRTGAPLVLAGSTGHAVAA